MEYLISLEEGGASEWNGIRMKMMYESILNLKCVTWKENIRTKVIMKKSKNKTKTQSVREVCESSELNINKWNNTKL